MKFKTLVVAGFCVAGASQTASAETISEALAKCSKQSNSLQRLVCYDRLVKDMNQYSGLEDSLSRRYPSPAAQQPAQPAAKLPAPAYRDEAGTSATTEFGLEHKKDNTTGEDTLYGTITKLDETLRGNHIVTLDNGTVWRQTDDGDLKLSVGQEVTIDRGVFSAFYLSHEGVNKRIRVERIK
ncbi:hypothetical protein [Alteromonas sp. CYL-A6]|uniref:hypothetical protein n=1 Tax=Alteromonas nitratireducens TaxID=3390813 RepID=UPI0034AE23F5